ncbi:phosphatase PAP2 family protein [Flavobacteriaceae bacterium TP-CH-4]|uniref:Phosphatase PAP2 family protein n=1 Tax=Pelagihabitans pacificus TaxID=2696054 RepID=A0A967ASI6_9FLAO|nr:phosphatase PAP2 family protein [Pelagihabitans pacificus]NHF58420.1 phosphatase PAP2 family protein [Pelagihabitans pacificus]
MRLFLRAISYIFHPIFVPIAGTLAYFLITPKYSPLELQSGNILPIFILTVIIPIISYLILTNLGVVSSVFNPDAKERRYSLYIAILLLLMVVYKVVPNNYTIELYYYFVGLIGASAASLLLLFLNFKTSLHVTGMASLFMYLICLSVHFEINITLALGFFILATGLVATSRLYLNVHSKTEVLIGFLIGLLSQLLTVRFWL